MKQLWKFIYLFWSAERLLEALEARREQLEHDRHFHLAVAAYWDRKLKYWNSLGLFDLLNLL